MSTATTVPKLSKGMVVEIRSLGFDEAYVQKLIEDDPSILGLGEDLVILDSQRRQDRAGRLDLLLQDGAQQRRYELELMLGSIDESHLIRTIEYWDIERRTYPAYEHCAVLVAENVSSRFLNVITLFSGSIPIIAIQMSAITVEEKTALTFIRVIDSRKLRRDDSSGNVSDKASTRAAWLAWDENGILEIVDRCFSFINEKAKRQRALNYNKQFIGLTENGRANNFVYFSPNKKSLWIYANLDFPDPHEDFLEEAGLEHKNDGTLRVKVTPKNFAQNESLIREMLQQAVEDDETK